MTDSSAEESLVLERYKFTVSYNGTAYQGFQIQGETRTVQLELEKALKQLGWQGTGFIGAGRTDTGVHAIGQVFNADLAWSHGTDALLKAMNAKLPKDIAITAVEKADADFHARFDAKWRCYHYHVYFAPVRNPLRDPLAWRLWPQPDIERLNEAAKEFPGIHDFRAFGSPPRKDRGTVREIKDSRWYELFPDEWVYEVRANAFLYHMVRRMVYVQVGYALGLIDIETVRNAVQKGIDAKPGLAPPNGLRLWNVTYGQPKKLENETK